MEGTILDFLLCEKPIWGGRTLSHLENGKAVFVEGAIAGEIVKALITREKKDYLEAKVIEVLEASSDRRVPFCRYFGLCGGCDWQHMAYERQVKEKLFIFKEVMKRQTSWDLNPSIYASPLEKNYRSRVQWHSNGEEWQFIPKKGKQNSLMEECPIVEKPLEDFLKKQEVPSQGKGRYSLITSHENVLKDWQKPFIGSCFIEEKEIFFHVKGFFQNNRSLLEDWISFIKKDLKGNILWDLYGGVGILSSFLEENFKEIFLVEISSFSLSLAQKNVRKAKIIEEDVFFFLTKQKKIADVVLLNPPRVGLDSKVTQELLKKTPKDLIYISCNPTTLARDFNILKEEYTIFRSAVFDFYPQTYHMESVLHLKRKNLI